VKTGVRRASGEVLLFMDGDGQHAPEEIPKLLEHLGEYDMVVGARSRSSDVALVRKLGNWGLIRAARIITGHKIDDLTSGFRAVKRGKFMEFFHLYPDRYSYPTTVTIAFLKSSYFVKYVSLSDIKKRKTGTSDINAFRDGMRFVYIMVRMLMLFSPQHIFLPFGLSLLFAGTCTAVYQIIRTGGIQGMSVILFMSGIFTFLIGLIAEQISAVRRERNQPKESLYLDSIMQSRTIDKEIEP
jgi:glycosyltransferase involved in cell wall biosynthesis